LSSNADDHNFDLIVIKLCQAGSVKFWRCMALWCRHRRCDARWTDTGL